MGGVWYPGWEGGGLVKKHSVFFLLAFLLLLFGCGSPPRDAGGGQSPQSETTASSAESPPNELQEFSSQEGESSLPGDGAPENLFVLYGDGKLIAAWEQDAEGNQDPISKEEAEKIMPPEIVEKVKSGKGFSSPQLSRVASGAPFGEQVIMDLYSYSSR